MNYAVIIFYYRIYTERGQKYFVAVTKIGSYSAL